MIGVALLLGCQGEPWLADDSTSGAVPTVTVFGQAGAAITRSDSDGSADDLERSSILRFGTPEWKPLSEAVSGAVGPGPGELVCALLFSNDASPSARFDRTNTAGILTFWYDPSRYQAFGAVSGVLSLPGAPAMVMDLPGQRMDVTPLEVRVHGRTAEGYVELLRDENTGDPGWLVYDAVSRSLLPGQATWLYALQSPKFPSVHGYGSAWDRDLADALYTNADAFPARYEDLIRRVPDVLVPDAQM